MRIIADRKGFYVYAGLLAMLDLVQSIGAGLLNYTQNPVGLCVVDLTAAMYLTLFTPLVYHTFLSEFFGYVIENLDRDGYFQWQTLI